MTARRRITQIQKSIKVLFKKTIAISRITQIQKSIKVLFFKKTIAIIVKLIRITTIVDF